MRNKKIVNIKELMESSALAEILQKSTALLCLNERLESIFPEEFKGLYRVSNITRNNLSIEVKNAAVRQSLMFRQHELLPLIRQIYPELTALSFKVNPNFK